MYKLNKCRFFFALTIGLVVAVGCSDANATEATYMPVYEPCVYSETPAPEHLIPEYDPAVIDQYLEPDGEESSSEQYDRDRADDPFHIFNERPFSQAAPYMGPTPAATPASTDANQGSSNSHTININSANADELTQLPGIGPALAQRILEYRQSRQFEDPAQLQRIKGIGPATFENIESLVRVD